VVSLHPNSIFGFDRFVFLNHFNISSFQFASIIPRAWTRQFKLVAVPLIHINLGSLVANPVQAYVFDGLQV
jgi:hypothetical protein